IAEYVTEARPGRSRIRAPCCDLCRIGSRARTAIRRHRVRREKRDLDARHVVAVAQPLEDANRGQLALAIQVVAGLRLDGGRASVEPLRKPACACRLECSGGLITRALHSGLDAAACLCDLGVRAA